MGKNLSPLIRIGLALGFSLFLVMPNLPEARLTTNLLPLLITKELLIGYLLGFFFSLLFEAAALAGQIVGTLSGFSITELFGIKREDSLFTKLFHLSLFILFFALDLHLLLLKFFFESFQVTPVFSMDQTLFSSLTKIFELALLYAFGPMVALTLLILTYAFLARVLPSMQIFWIGFPLQLLIGILAVCVSLPFFSEMLSQAFFEWVKAAKRLFFSL